MNYLLNYNWAFRTFFHLPSFLLWSSPIATVISIDKISKRKHSKFFHVKCSSARQTYYYKIYINTDSYKWNLYRQLLKEKKKKRLKKTIRRVVRPSRKNRRREGEKIDEFNLITRVVRSHESAKVRAKPRPWIGTLRCFIADHCNAKKLVEQSRSGRNSRKPSNDAFRVVT